MDKDSKEKEERREDTKDPEDPDNKLKNAPDPEILDEADTIPDDQSLKRTTLAMDRTDYAIMRTSQSAERTYAAWVRTGFAIASAGTAIGELLKTSKYSGLSTGIGYVLITIGIVSFLFGWAGYFRSFQILMKYPNLTEDNRKTLKVNFIFLTIITIFLLIVSIAAYYLLYL